MTCNIVSCISQPSFNLSVIWEIFHLWPQKKLWIVENLDLADFDGWLKNILIFKFLFSEAYTHIHVEAEPREKKKKKNENYENLIDV